MQGIRNTGVRQYRASARFRVIATVLRKLALKLSGAHIVRVGGVGARVNGIALAHRLPHLRVPLDDHIQHPLILVGELVLVELAHAHAGLKHDLAGALIKLTAEHFHQRGFAATIGSDQPIAVAVGEFDRDLFKKRLGAELDAEIGGGKHGRVLVVTIRLPRRRFRCREKSVLVKARDQKQVQPVTPILSETPRPRLAHTRVSCRAPVSPLSGISAEASPPHFPDHRQREIELSGARAIGPDPDPLQNVGIRLWRERISVVAFRRICPTSYSTLIPQVHAGVVNAAQRSSVFSNWPEEPPLLDTGYARTPVGPPR